MQSKQINYYWLVPVILFIITQSGVAIWWASDLNTSVNTMQEQVLVLSDAGNTENLRQWTDINENQDNISGISRELAINNSQLQNLNGHFDRVQETLTENNRLIRQLIQQQGILVP